ncbi:MAG: beta-galactosidase small subunit, partial [Vallitaleaceae bacterium]|nr:beta-galactosidase small subunit [Vallitaleaceae bacterium]
FELRFSRELGHILDVSKAGTLMIKGPVYHNFWRATIDNDYLYIIRDMFKFLDNKWLGTRWKRAMEKNTLKACDVSVQGQQVNILTKHKMPGIKGTIDTEYKIYENGYIHIKSTIIPKHDLIRFGQSMLFNKELSQVAWCGRGPHENYIDRCSSAYYGIYELPVSDMTHYYLRPQENGNRTGIKWLELKQSKALGNNMSMRFQNGEGELNASVWPYTIQDLEKATHIHELKATIEDHEDEMQTYYQINIDAGQRGVGGDIPAIAMLKESYKMKKNQPYQLDYWIQI